MKSMTTTKGKTAGGCNAHEITFPWVRIGVKESQLYLLALVNGPCNIMQRQSAWHPPPICACRCRTRAKHLFKKIFPKTFFMREHGGSPPKLIPPLNQGIAAKFKITGIFCIKEFIIFTGKLHLFFKQVRGSIFDRYSFYLQYFICTLPAS